MKTNQEIAKEVLSGLWGNGAERRARLEEAGYNYNEVQTIVNALVYERDNVQAVEVKPEHKVKNPLEVDYDFNINDGIIVNIII